VQAKAPRADASKLAELPKYTDKVIERMKHTDKDAAGRKKRVAEQEQALLRLKRVIEARLRSESDAGDPEALAFDAGLDDDETLLRLMHAVDSDKGSNGDGAISEQELLGSKQLTAEMGKALRSAFACSLEAVQEALAKVKAEDFGEAVSGASGPLFDSKAAVKALIDGLEPSAAASGWVGKAGLESLSTKLKGAGKKTLEDLANPLRQLAADAQLDFLALKDEARRVPRVRGARVDWARGLGLDAALARQLPPGTLEDGLAGVRGMPSEEAKRAVDAFLDDARVRILTALVEVKTAKGSKSAAEANSKFAGGFQGSFATLKDFHQGAEKSLQLGYPNPDTMKGILLEHTQHPSATKLFCTSNYRITTCLLIEYAWALLGDGGSLEGLKAIWTGNFFPMAEKELVKARNLVRDLINARDGMDAASAKARDEQILFPGEVGDRFAESLVMLTFTGVPVGSPAAKMIGDKAREVAAKLLETRRSEGVTTTDEELARGVAMLNHEACMERISKGTGTLLNESSRQVAADDGPLRVGVVLPMSAVRAEAMRDGLLAGVKAAVRDTGVTFQGVTEELSERMMSFSRFTSVQELRKWLAEKSLADLLEVLKDDGIEKEWAHVDPAEKSDTAACESLCQAMVSSFVRTELQADLRAALISSNASDAQKNGLMRVWKLKSVEDLDSEEKWSKVEGWVRLYQGRIQGRTRLGLAALMKREKVKIDQYGLTASEVLGAHIYTGANFVPLNAICRSFPSSILELLKGDATTPDNKMCTTLFCISSALKKLSMHTGLPESRCRPWCRPSISCWQGS
jgi:hypothetical protein